MDQLTKPLHAHLVTMAYQGTTHEQEHQMEHLLTLLAPNDEEAIVSYYGLFGQPRLSLAEIARKRNETPEQALEAISILLRRIAVTPEWQMLQNQLST